MNEQTQKILSDLAAKLGTTAEHLWGVLIRQAPISVSADLVWIIAIGYVLYRLCRWNSRNEHDMDEGFIWTGIVAGISTWCVIIASNLPYILSGYFNPEYWALKQLIK